MADRRDVPQRLRHWADRARRAVDDARHRAEEAAQSAQDSASKWALLLHNVQDDRASGDVLAKQLDDALESLGPQLDRECGAVAVGMVRRAGAGVAPISGQCLTYVRPDGPIRAQIRFSELSGRSASLSLGTSAGGFAACLYGERAALLEPLTWRGGDAGLLMASIGLFRATPKKGPKASGWLVGVGAGVGLGIPLISDISGFEWEELRRSVHVVSTAGSRPIEARLAACPDRRLRRRAAAAL